MKTTACFSLDVAFCVLLPAGDVGLGALRCMARRQRWALFFVASIPCRNFSLNEGSCTYQRQQYRRLHRTVVAAELVLLLQNWLAMSFFRLMHPSICEV